MANDNAHTDFAQIAWRHMHDQTLDTSPLQYIGPLQHNHPLILVNFGPINHSLIGVRKSLNNFKFTA